MGLLSDPSLAPRNKLGLSLAKHTRKLCYLFYIAGLVWFICLAHSDFNHGTYLSENALSPGLVYPEIRIESNRLAVQLHDELLREHKEHKSTTPHAWIAAKMRQFGLETHIHNFTLRYPFSNGKEYHGKNIYGILRAPRIGSTEGIVFSAPYRPPSSVHADISASVPVLLAFAEFARRKNYWAKDLVFLVTEQEQLGMHAWLEAYHEGDKDTETNNILRHGTLPARAGALQAALNLEIQDIEIDYIDVKIEGLNGKLPNLDMFNLVQRISSREGITSGYKQTPRRRRRSSSGSSSSSMEQNLYNMISMLASQAPGVPNGNHGLFLRYRIEALTIEAVKRVTNNKTGRNSAAMPLLKIIEGISRSLNNLLERFHQSFFFYIIVHNDRYISIGDYMPCLIALAGCLFIKAFLTWVSLCDSCIRGDSDCLEEINDELKSTPSSTTSSITPSIPSALSSSENSDDISELGTTPNTSTTSITSYSTTTTTTTNTDSEEERSIIVTTSTTSMPLPYKNVVLYIGIILSLGYISSALPMHPYLLISSQFNSVAVIGGTLLITSFLGLILPYVLPMSHDALELLHIGFLVFHGVTLIIIGLLNFALGFFVAIISVPVIIALDSNMSNATLLSIVRFFTFMLNPLIVVYTIVLFMTFQQFPELRLKELLMRAVNATMDGITYSFIDSLIYGNWVYIAATVVFLPSWMAFWTLAATATTSPKSNDPLLPLKLKMH